jgi:fluoride exporter
LALALIALGGAGGAISRYLVDTFVSERVGAEFPWGTFAVNMTGSFVLGVLFALAVERDVLPSDIRLPVMTGFVGAYTTFSTLMLETWRLVESGSTLAAMANVIGSVAVGLMLMAGGLVVGRAIP